MSYFILTILSSNIILVVIDPYRSHFPMYLANITSPLGVPVGYSWISHMLNAESHRRSVSPTVLIDSHDPVMRRLQSRSPTAWYQYTWYEKSRNVYSFFCILLVGVVLFDTTTKQHDHGYRYLQDV